MSALQGVACRPRVLLAENSNVLEFFHKSLFESLGFQVDVVKNGYEVQQKIRQGKYN